MGRPKGSTNKQKDLNKYWLPEGVTLKPGQGSYVQESKLTFIDFEFGEYISTFKAHRRAANRCHPDFTVNKRLATIIDRYGSTNFGASSQIRAKAKATMLKRHGVEHALQNDTFLNKSKQTLMINHGVDQVMKSPELREKVLGSLGNNGKTVSKGEASLKEYITSLGFTCKPGFFGGKQPCQIDIKLEESNICFEYNGEFYHSVQKGRDIGYHLRKTNLAVSKGYRLIHIFENEWVDTNFQIKSFIRSALNKNTTFVNGRSTEIREVHKVEARDFLDKYHILGSTKFKHAYGLYFQNELQSLITIGFHHRGNKTSNGDTEVVLSRYVSKYDTTVRGGLSKLCKHAKKIHGSFNTWIDLRFSDGSNWVKSGWVELSRSRPDYFYYSMKLHKVIPKQARKKSRVGTSDDMTEFEHADKDGLLRIYDCGKLKLIY